ncbi:hypothetical protein B566_EDAN007744, partial [Ephemera danica]
MQKKYLTFIFIATIFHQGWTLKCYECFNNLNCGDPFNPAYQVEKECTSSTACINRQYTDVGTGDIFADRFCYGDSLTDMSCEDFLAVQNIPGVFSDVKCYQCEEDLCNGPNGYEGPLTTTLEGWTLKCYECFGDSINCGDPFNPAYQFEKECTSSTACIKIQYTEVGTWDIFAERFCYGDHSPTEMSCEEFLAVQNIPGVFSDVKCYQCNEDLCNGLNGYEGPLTTTLEGLSAIACHKCEPPNDCRNPDINPPPPDDREAICFEPEAVCTTTQRTQDVGGISNTIIERGCSDSTMFCEDFRALYEPSLTNVQCEVCKNDSFCNNKIFALPETTPTVSSTTITTTPSTTTTIRSSPSTTTSRPMKTTWKYDRSSTISRWSIRTTTRTTRKY